MSGEVPDMSAEAFQTVVAYVELIIALWLYCRRLPHRKGFVSRVIAALTCTTVLVACSTYLGFSMYPPLTDDASFYQAVGAFVAVLVFMVASVLLIWETSLWTALFCSSSAYLLQNLASGVDRLAHLTRLVPSAPFAEGGTPTIPATDVISAILSATMVFSAFYLMFISHLSTRGLEGVGQEPMAFSILVAMLVSIVFDLAIKDLPTLDVPWRYPVVLSVVHMALCAFILMAEFEIIYNRSLRENVAVMERVVTEQERQYELSEQTIQAINHRVHNMRHHVFSILTAGNGAEVSRDKLRQIARELQVYDASVKTGNTALDVVLTEKGLVCADEGITLTCVADGHALDFMAASDIYTLFSTAIDGAIAAVQDTHDKNQQAISFNVRNAMGMASISIEHYLIGNDQIDPQKVAAGERRLETMRAIVERYDGAFVLGDANASHVFHLDALIPMP